MVFLIYWENRKLALRPEQNWNGAHFGRIPEEGKPVKPVKPGEGRARQSADEASFSNAPASAADALSTGHSVRLYMACRLLYDGGCKRSLKVSSVNTPSSSSCP